MYWFYVILMFALVAACGYGAYKCAKNLDYSAFHFIGAFVLLIGVFLCAILGIRALKLSNVVEQSNVLITEVTATTTNSGPTQVKLKGVYDSGGSANYTCSDISIAQQCANLAPGDVVVFREVNNEFGFNHTEVTLPERSTDPN